jgi:hypothetical protein
MIIRFSSIKRILICYFLVTNELMQEKQRGNDFEEELQLIQKHLKTTQSKVAEQVNNIKNIFLIFLNIKTI